MTILIGNLTNVFGGITNPGAFSVTTITTTAYFNSQVHRLALILVYLGIGVFFATYIGSVCWIITGERISRRIRVYAKCASSLTLVIIYVQSSVRISPSSIVLVQVRSQTVSPMTVIFFKMAFLTRYLPSS